MSDNHKEYIPFHLKEKTVADLLAEYRTSPVNKFEQNYKIILNQDGSVFDYRKKLCYSTLKTWATEVLHYTGE